MKNTNEIKETHSENPFKNTSYNMPYVFKIRASILTDTISLFSEEEKNLDYLSGTLTYKQVLTNLNQLQSSLQIEKIIFIGSANFLMVTIKEDQGEGISCQTHLPCFKDSTLDNYMVLNSGGDIFSPICKYSKGLTFNFDSYGITHVLVYTSYQ